MSAGEAPPRRCERCGTLQQETFRFCPECALPLRSAPILSSEILEARRRAVARDDARGSRLRRAAAIAALAVPAAAVIVIALLLFNEDLLDRVLGEPPRRNVAMETPVATRRHWEPEWVVIPQGTYTVGPPGSDREYEYSVIADFWITRHEITNGLWQRFIAAERHALEREGLWDLSIPRDGWITEPDAPPRPTPDEYDRPVRDVCALSVVRFGFWLTKALGVDADGFVTRLPDAIEWEIAARGKTAGPYPWGRDFYGTSSGLAAEPRPRIPLGLSRPQAVWSIGDDVSPFDVVGMATNVAEFVLVYPLQPGQRLVDAVQERDNLSARGATFSSNAVQAEVLAEVWTSARDMDARHRMPDVGVRMVKVRFTPE